MGQILHGSATTTPLSGKNTSVWGEHPQPGRVANINPNTVHKWKNRNRLKTRSVVVNQARAVADRAGWSGHYWNPTQNIITFGWSIGSFATTDSRATRSNLHRCLQRHGVSRLADLLPPDEKTPTKAFKDYQPGFLHIDTAQINQGKEKWYLFVAIDRATRYVYLELHDNKRMETATSFLRETLQQYPFKIEKILTDNGIKFSYNLLIEAKQPKNKVHPFVALARNTTLNTVRHSSSIHGLMVWLKLWIKRLRQIPLNVSIMTGRWLKRHLFTYLMNYNFNLIV